MKIAEIKLAALMLLALFVSPALAEDIPPEIVPFMLTAEDIGPEFTLVEQDFYAVKDVNGNIFSFPRQRFAGEDDSGATTRVIVKYGIAPSSFELPEVWQSFTLAYPGPRTVIEAPDLEGVEDFLIPSNNSNGVAFLKGLAQVSMGVYRTDEDSAQARETLIRLKGVVLDKMDAQGVASLSPFQVEVTKQLTNDGTVIVEGMKTSGEYPFRYSVYLGVGQLSEDVQSFPLTETEDGSFRVETIALQSGNYDITVNGEDLLGRPFSYWEEFEVADSGPISILTSQDTSLIHRKLHQNEGANPLLALEKIQGKATRIAVAFDLAGVALNGLSRATLVLTIEPNEHIDGWGNGRTISAQAITTPWQEGNGWSFGLKKKDQIAGSGSGATWFSPVDEDISNESANSVVNWNGATSSVYPPTAPAVQIDNFQSGEIAFDVTTDVLNGAENGWLVLKDQENVGSKVSFYSREGAAAAGNPDLAPRLILEFGDPVASAAIPADSFLAKTGLGSISTKFRVTQNGGELRSVREILQDSPVAALATEQLLSEATRTNPVLNLTARTAYRSWLAEDLRIAAVPVRFV